MATLIKVSSEEIRKARKAGFKRKAPKKPKRTASVTTLENYISRHNEWAKELKSAGKNVDKKKTLLKTIFK